MAADLPDLIRAETAIIELTNTYRGEQKLSAVKLNPELTAAARAFATYLAQKGAFSHTADGKTPAQRTEKAGYAYCEVGENLALNQDSRGFKPRDLAAQAVTGWINSPGHRANIVSPHVTEIGVGIAASADKVLKFISVQLFARPRSAQIEFQIANTSKASVTYKLAGQTHDIAPRMSVTHSECRPGALEFSRPGSLLSSRQELGRFEAADGKLYTIKSDANDNIRIDVGQREKLR